MIRVNNLKFLILFSFLHILILTQNCERNSDLTQPKEEAEDQNNSIIIHNRSGSYYQTTHFNIYYSKENRADSLVAVTIANYAESVYQYVNKVYSGNAPDFRTPVYLTEECTNCYCFGGNKPDGIYLYLDNSNNMKQIFAHEFGHVTFHYLTQKKARQFDFINEGISVLIELHYEQELGEPEPWEMRAYWACSRGIIDKEELSDWNHHESDLGNIFHSVGYAFNVFFREKYGLEKWIDFIKSLARSISLNKAFQHVGLSYDVFYDEWIGYLNIGYKSNEAQLSLVPLISDSLIIETHTTSRNVKVKIIVHNGETSRYTVWFSYYIDTFHDEPYFQSQRHNFEKIVVIGEDLTPGTKILYDIVVLSDILKTWIKSGWRIFWLS